MGPRNGTDNVGYAHPCTVPVTRPAGCRTHHLQIASSPSSEERSAQVQGPQESRDLRGQFVGAGEHQQLHHDQGEGCRSLRPDLYLIMLGLMVLGLLWLIVFYLWGPSIPFMSGLGNWNFGVGFLLMIAGLLMTMRWR